MEVGDSPFGFHAGSRPPARCGSAVGAGCRAGGWGGRAGARGRCQGETITAFASHPKGFGVGGWRGGCAWQGGHGATVVGGGRGGF